MATTLDKNKVQDFDEFSSRGGKKKINDTLEQVRNLIAEVETLKRQGGGAAIGGGGGGGNTATCLGSVDGVLSYVTVQVISVNPVP